jgi:hydrogenase maturation factor
LEVWPWSIVDGLADNDTAKAEFTVTVAVAVAVLPRESVTFTQYVVVDVGEAEYVLDDEDWRGVPVQLLVE